MTLLNPGWLAIGVGAAIALVALHLLALGRPSPLLLPTARFVPQRAARARRLARRPTDLLLLAARAAVVLLGGLALARPTRTPTRRPVARVIVADRSRSAAAAAVRDSVRGVAGEGDLLIGFDTTASAPVVLGRASAERDSTVDRTLAAPATTPVDAPAAAASTDAAAESAVAAGSLSAALAAARRAAPLLRAGADSLELVVVSSLTTAEVDAATAALRMAWGGRARMVQVAAANGGSTVGGVGPIRVVWRRGAPDDDALAAAVALGARMRDRSSQGGSPPLHPGSQRAAPPPASFQRTTPQPQRTVPPDQPAPIPTPAVLVIRDGATSADSARARDSATVVVDWPADGVPNGWRRSARADTAGAVAAGVAAFVAPLARQAEWPARTSGTGANGTGANGRGTRIVARWADGTPAAVERPLGAGCIRAVAVPVPQVGDAALRAPFRALLAALTGPCAHRTTGVPLDGAAVRALAGAGPLLATRSLADATAPDDPLARWLLAAALLLLVAELPLRLVGRSAPNEVLADARDTSAQDAEAAA